MPATWLCPSCGRRVPASLGECRCGLARPSEALAQRATARAKLPRDVKALVVVLILVLVAGVVALFFPYGPNKLPKLLGIVDERRAPVATPTKPRP